METLLQQGTQYEIYVRDIMGISSNKVSWFILLNDINIINVCAFYFYLLFIYFYNF